MSQMNEALKSKWSVIQFAPQMQYLICTNPICPNILAKKRGINSLPCYDIGEKIYLFIYFTCSQTYFGASLSSSVVWSLFQNPAHGLNTNNPVSALNKFASHLGFEKYTSNGLWHDSVSSLVGDILKDSAECFVMINVCNE